MASSQVFHFRETQRNQLLDLLAIAKSGQHGMVNVSLLSQSREQGMATKGSPSHELCVLTHYKRWNVISSNFCQPLSGQLTDVLLILFYVLLYNDTILFLSFPKQFQSLSSFHRTCEWLIMLASKSLMYIWIFYVTFWEGIVRFH